MLSTAIDLDLRPLARVFRALGDETRLRIAVLLSHGELCVCHVEHALGLSQPNASRQLGILRSAGVVESRRDGTWVYYRLATTEHVAVRSVLALLTGAVVTRRTLRADLARLRKQCGPGACR
jgi:ArsR family transcriptional regulator